MPFYHDGHRALQARFGSTPLAERLEQVTHRTRLTEVFQGHVTNWL